MKYTIRLAVLLKSLVFSVIYSSLIVSGSLAVEWELIGEKGFADKWISSAIVVDSESTPYIGYIDDFTGKPLVKKFDGNTWNVLNEISIDVASDLDIAVDNSDSVYVLFGDYTHSYKTTVKKFYKNGSFWETVGNPGFSDGTINSSSTFALATDSNSTPYVIYRDNVNSDQATVMKFNNVDNNWSVVGAVGFSSGSIINPDIVLDSNNIPYVAYNDAGNSNEITVMKFTGTWVTVGPAGFTEGASYMNLAIDSNDLPYIVYGDSFDKVAVMKFNGAAWGYISTTDLSPGLANWASLAIDSNDVPYVSFADGSNNYKVTVMKDEGSGWSNVGSAGFSDGFSRNTDIAINNGIIHVLFDDETTDNNLTVMKYGDSKNQVGFNPAVIMYLLN